LEEISLQKHLTTTKKFIKRNKRTIELLMPTTNYGLATIFFDDDDDDNNNNNNNITYVIRGGPEPGQSVSEINEIFHIG
jgi:hypothetical protein